MGRVAFETAVLHHDERGIVAPDQAGDVLGVRHRGAEHELVALRISADEGEGIGHFAIGQARILGTVLEDEDAAVGHDSVGNCGSPQQMFMGATT